ncbi:hypothetical protein GCM10009678_22370 [Actinomadura kijaniata]|uniref:Mce-associated membrane protein n=1 Tax=Actinomadura namibiensis TaxID=182080 RepID=A0A7W3LN23_ACTNM|nr:hypothetical protein [Actinomadura namibiensis]MBA8951170.1 Mce-associated membrane protein [Actinomadura namibiensis]
MSDTKTAEKSEPETSEPEAKDTGRPAGKEPGATPEEPPKDRPTGPSLRKDPLVRVAVALAAAAAVAAAWFGWSYHAASGDDGLAFARQRDEALRAAEQAVVNLNTLDHRNADAGLKIWQDSTTADLYDQIVQGRDRLKQDVEKARTTSTATILESGLTELDAHAGKASVAVAVRITITAADGRPAIQTRRLTGQLTRTAAGWKLSSLGQAPSGATG